MDEVIKLKAEVFDIIRQQEALHLEIQKLEEKKRELVQRIIDLEREVDV